MQYQAGAKRPNYVLPKGEYPARIIKAEEKTSKVKPDGSGGNPMLALELEVYDNDKKKLIRDYIVLGGEFSADWKIGHLVKSCGLPADGSLDANALVERFVRVKVKIKPAKGEYEEDNAIDDYIEPQVDGEAKTTPVRGSVSNAAAISDSEVPF